MDLERGPGGREPLSSFFADGLLKLMCGYFYGCCNFQWVVFRKKDADLTDLACGEYG